MQTIQERVKSLIARLSGAQFDPPWASLRQSIRTTDQAKNEAPLFVASETALGKPAFGFVTAISVCKTKCADGNVDYLDIELDNKLGIVSKVSVRLGSEYSAGLIASLNGADFTKPVEIESILDGLTPKASVSQHGYKVDPVYTDGGRLLTSGAGSGTGSLVGFDDYMRPINAEVARLVSSMQARLDVDRKGQQVRPYSVAAYGNAVKPGQSISNGESFDAVSGEVRDAELITKNPRSAYPVDVLRVLVLATDSATTKGTWMNVDVSLDGVAGAKFLGQLNAANLAHPISIESSFLKGSVTDAEGTIIVLQDGKEVVPRYSKGRLEMPIQSFVTQPDGTTIGSMEPIRSEAKATLVELSRTLGVLKEKRHAYARSERLEARQADKALHASASHYLVNAEGKVFKTDPQGAAMKSVASISGTLTKTVVSSVREGKYTLDLEFNSAEEDLMVVRFALGSGVCTSVLGRLNAADLGQPVTIESVLQDEQAPFLGKRILVKQDGQVLAAVYAKGVELPKASVAATEALQQAIADTIEEINAKLGALSDEESSKSRSRYAERG